MTVFTGPQDRRRSDSPRRGGPARGGRRATDVVRTSLLAWLLALMATWAVAQTPMHFGFDIKSLALARTLGVPVTYGSTWDGDWIQ